MLAAHGIYTSRSSMDENIGNEGAVSIYGTQSKLKIYVRKYYRYIIFVYSKSWLAEPVR